MPTGLSSAELKSSISRRSSDCLRPFPDSTTTTGPFFLVLIATESSSSNRRIRVFAVLARFARRPAPPFWRSISPITGLERRRTRSEEHTSELQSLMRISYAVFCLKKKRNQKHTEKFTKKHKI